MSEPTTIHCDTKAPIQIEANAYRGDCHFIQERLQQGLIKKSYINTKDQHVDLLTKALGRAQNDFLLAKLGVLNVFNTSSLRGNIEDKEAVKM